MLLAVALGLGAGAGSARAEKVHDLSRLLVSGKTEKERIAAAVSLGRLRDDRALKPLVRALSDESNVVRALAATALGYLDLTAALPALQRAAKDTDSTVRRRATEAIAAIRQGASATTPAPEPFIQAARYDKLANYAIAPQEPARTPQVYVVVKSALDKSVGSAPVKIRQMQASAMRTLIVDELRRDQQVTLMTMAPSVATELGMEPYAIDVTIMKLERMERGAHIEIECEIRVAVSNDRGKMLSFLTGGAKVQVPKRTFRAVYEPQLKREALENAVKSVHQDLVAYLRNRPS